MFNRALILILHSYETLESPVLFSFDFSHPLISLAHSVPPLLIQKDRLAEENISSKVNIYVCVVAAMEHSLQNFKELADGVFAVHYLKKGISDYYEFPQVREKLGTMLQMESRLEYAPDSSESIFFPFGYKKSEALYGTDEWNAVNNLFPVFWWGKWKDGKKRTPLFIRG